LCRFSLPSDVSFYYGPQFVRVHRRGQVGVHSRSEAPFHISAWRMGREADTDDGGRQLSGHLWHCENVCGAQQNRQRGRIFSGQPSLHPPALPGHLQLILRSSTSPPRALTERCRPASAKRNPISGSTPYRAAQVAQRNTADTKDPIETWAPWCAHDFSRIRTWARQTCATDGRSILHPPPGNASGVQFNVTTSTIPSCRATPVP
jgi:hypothetical protein